MDRREFVGAASLSVAGLAVGSVLGGCASGSRTRTRSAARAKPNHHALDRRALVSRHNVVLTSFDAANPLSVGNGRFCFTVDATGLQTFPERFANTTPLGTLSDWGWHSFPNPDGWDVDKFAFRSYPDLNGRLVPYCDAPGKRSPEIQWLRANPHRLHLGQIGFVLTHADGSSAQPGDLTHLEQTLDLWNGEIRSCFQFDGEPVEVHTVCAPASDAIAVRVVSPLMKQRRLAIQIRFSYGTGATATVEWSKPEAHETICSRLNLNGGRFTRRLDNDSYLVTARWTATATVRQTSRHGFLLRPLGDDKVLELVCHFSPKAGDSELPMFETVQAAAQTHWNCFWSTGGALDLSGSKDPRWFELERRLILSQYLVAIQDAGDNPPQETGLTCNSWEGKFHLEMHWWHEAHFALWGRLPLLERSLGFYGSILPRAEATSRRQGYAGARWPKMTCPSGAESPSPVGPFLIWQQPHPIFYAELCWRQHHDVATLNRYRDIVFATADFMASYATWDKNTRRYVLGPTLQCAQEIFPKENTFNPTFELAYWRWGLEAAQAWRTRLGMPREKKWDAVLAGLASLPLANGRYLFAESAPDCYTNRQWVRDHPSVVGALSFVPGPGVDLVTMRNTLDWIWQNWQWPDTWGWDYPLLAMTAARLGDPERAIDALLLDTPKNRYGINGHVYQRPGLSVYLPANGGLLYAVALMAAGWDGAPQRHAPGFPDNGQWEVRWENLRRAP